MPKRLTYTRFGQNGTLQGQYFRSAAAPQRDPLTVFGRIRVIKYGPNTMSAFFGRDSGKPDVLKEWSLFTAPGNATAPLEISLEVQTPGGSSGMGVNVPDPFGWHDVALVRAGASWTLRVDDRPPATNPVAEIPQSGSALSVGFVPGMFSGLLYSIADLMDWRVWEAALTADEIAAERASSRPKRQAGLWAWWLTSPQPGRDGSRQGHGLVVMADGGTARVAVQTV